MNCKDIQALLPEFNDQALGQDAATLVTQHLETCRSCTTIVQRDRQLQDSLRALPVPVMPDGLPARLLRAAQDQHEPNARPSWRAGLGVAASVLMVSGLALLASRGIDGGSADPQTVSFAVGQTQMVALKIDAPQSFESVKFEVELPENVALADQPGLREFAWSGQLQAGVNVLSLPLVGVMPQSGHLIATVSYGNTRRSLDVPLRVAKPAQG